MGISAYTKTAWANGVAPAINATNLNKIEDRLYDLTEEIITPTMASTTTATQQIISLPSTTLKSRLDLTVAGNTTSGYDSYTKLLMFFEGADGSTTFIDQTGKTVTASGNAQIDTAQYRYGSASGLFDGTGDYLTVTDANDELDIGTQDFTIECWARFNSIAVDGYPFDFRQTSLSDLSPLILFRASTAKIEYYSGLSTFRVSTTSIVAGTWYHIAVSRISGISKLFINGSQEGNNLTDTTNFIPISDFKIGSRYTGAHDFINGWIDEFRVSVGIGRYTSSFIPTTLETLSTNRQIVKSVGKNLFDGTVVGLSGQVEAKMLSKSSFTLKATGSSGIYVHNLFPNIKFRENTRYRIFYKFFEDDNTKNTRLIINYTDGTFTQGSNPTLVLTASGFSSNENKTIKGISYSYGISNGTTTFLDFQIQEYDKTPYVYEQYTETSAIVPAELKKISSTIFDTYDANSGQHTKNVEADFDVSGTKYASQDTTTYTNVDVVKTTAFSLMKPATTSVDSVTRLFDKNLKQLEEVAQADIDLVASVGKYYIHTDKSIWFIVAADTYVNIAAARTGLGTCKILYQLATPIITNYYSNTLTAEPSGTIYTYPFVADYDFYDTGAGVNNTTFPIDSLEYVNIVNKDTGALTPVDLSTCTVASGGLSFTSTSLTANDLVDFGYTYKDLTTVADVIYSHPTDLKATVDGNTNNIRDLDEKIEQSNTVTTLTLKEIERDARILKIMGGI